MSNSGAGSLRLYKTGPHAGTYSALYKGYWPEKGWGRWRRPTGERTERRALQVRDGWIAESRKQRQEEAVTSPVHEPPQMAGDMTYREIRDFYLERKGLTEDKNPLKAWDYYLNVTLRNPRWSTVTVEMLEPFIQARSGEIAKATLRNELVYLNVMVKLAVRRGRLAPQYGSMKLEPRDLIGTIPQNPHRPWSEKWWYELFIHYLEFWFAQVVRFAWLTGWRRKQIENLRIGTPPAGWANLECGDQGDHGYIDLETKTLWPHRQKRGEQIEFYYPDYPALEQVIEQQLAWRQTQGYDDRPDETGKLKKGSDPNGYFFRRPANYLRKRRNSDTVVDNIGEWKKVWKRAIRDCHKHCENVTLAAQDADYTDPITGLTVREGETLRFAPPHPRYQSELHFHGFRHAVVTRLSDLGVRPKVIAQLTGHKSLGMVDRYDRAEGSRTLAPALEKVS